MNSYITVGIIVLLVIVLFLLIKLFVPSVKKMIVNMPKWLILVLMAVVTVAIILLVKSLATTGGMIGGDGSSGTDILEKPEFEEQDLSGSIIIRAEQIILEGKPSDTKAVSEWLDRKAAEEFTVILVDDYASASVYRTVKNMCEDKGVNYNTQDEKWLK